MKVLFAVSNEEIFESIVKKYQKEYKQIISYKNVYYFNAILKEIQKDKTYDRIVISEDLESFSHTQYDQIDKFIFEKLDSISDEASNIKGNDTPIILICADRRNKGEEILVKLFSIGIYNAILGNDRSVEEVCRLINRPRVKKEAKAYYNIDSEDADYKPENENDVSEMEIQNILAHYKRLGKNEERYIDSFNNIAAQYNDTQLRVISNFLPLNVRAVLEEKSVKYQQVMSFNNSVSNSLRKDNSKKDMEGPTEKLLKPKEKDSIMTKPVVIPTAMNLEKGKRLSKESNNSHQQTQRYQVANSNNNTIDMQQQEKQRRQQIKRQQEMQRQQQIKRQQEIQRQQQIKRQQEMQRQQQMKKQQEMQRQGQIKRQQEIQNQTPIDRTVSQQQVEQTKRTQERSTEQNMEVPAKRKRGRPRKNEGIQPPVGLAEEKQVKRGRGRPRKNPSPIDIRQTELVQYPEESENNSLPGFDDIEEKVLPGFDNYKDEKINNNDKEIISGFDDDFEQNEGTLPGFDNNFNQDEGTLPGFDNNFNQDEGTLPGFDNNFNQDEGTLPGFDNNFNQDEGTLPGFDNNFNQDEGTLPGFDNKFDQDEDKLAGFNNDNLKNEKNNEITNNVNNTVQSQYYEPIKKQPEYVNKVDLSMMLTPDKKIASFVGTSKNGTSFIVNNIAELMSSMGVNTAILDTTKNRNSYYIYTKNEEELRNIASKSLDNLVSGNAVGIEVNKNLSVYTSLPNETEQIVEVDLILESLLKKHSLILIDSDFDTPMGYFKQSQELYLVQSLDILTIQPLTAFLRELKAKNILDEKKLRIILNKAIKIRGINERTIIGGMAYFNDPAMSYMTELFDRNLVKYKSIPLDEEVYMIYLENIINCNINIRGYSKTFIQSLKELGNMIYPLSGDTGTYRPPSVGYSNAGTVNNGGFTPNINSTLNQMKKNY